MLDSDSWQRLVKGLITATENGGLEWSRKQSPAGHGVATTLRLSALHSVLDKRVLRATAEATTYELTADSFGRPPYELAVWREAENKKKPIGALSSSTSVESRDFYQTNILLQRLFRVADTSAEEAPDALVDRLLGELGTD